MARFVFYSGHAQSKWRAHTGDRLNRGYASVSGDWAAGSLFAYTFSTETVTQDVL
jgi:hypothetical protein